jgi:hypothetical protein
MEHIAFPPGLHTFAMSHCIFSVSIRLCIKPMKSWFGASKAYLAAICRLQRDRPLNPLSWWNAAVCPAGCVGGQAAQPGSTSTRTPSPSVQLDSYTDFNLGKLNILQSIVRKVIVIQREMIYGLRRFEPIS